MRSADRQLAAEAAAGARGSGKWRRGRCPFCEKRVGSSDRRGSFAVHVSGFCMCWRCSIRVWLPGSDPEMFEADELGGAAPAQCEVPEDYVPLSDRDTVEILGGAGVYGYLRERGVPRSAIDALGIGVCFDGLYRDRVLVPMLGPDGAWTGFSARLWARSGNPKYRYPPGMVRSLWNVSACSVKTEQPLMVVEGVFDALPYWPHACALLGKPTADHIEVLAQAERPSVVVLDGDAWKEARSLAWQLRSEGVDHVRWVKLPPKTDPGSVDPRWLVGEVRAALRTPLTF